MIYITIAVLAYVILTVLIQSWIVGGFVRLLFSRKPRQPHRADLPKAAVVIAVRGTDPFLEGNLRALLQQDYPDFKMIVVVDNIEDPAWPMIQRFHQSAPDRIEVQFLQNPPSTCSLKCSSMAQVVDGLDSSYEVVAFMDGDVLPHQDWLRDLVEPLEDRSVGVATGTRWYMPKQGDWGSLVRYFWNVGAVAQAWLNDMVWGGSMAMRRDVMLKIGLPAAMRKALADDATVVRQMKAYGYKTRFVPAVTMANREEISLPSFVQWSERQMISAKSCGPNFRMVDIHGFSIFCCMFLPVVTAVAGWREGNSLVVGISLIAMATFWLAAAGATIAMELGARHALSINHSDVKWLNLRTIIRLLPALVTVHFVYFRLLAGAHSRNRVSWRGVEYEIRGIYDVRLLKYRPYKGSFRPKLVESVL